MSTQVLGYLFWILKHSSYYQHLHPLLQRNPHIYSTSGMCQVFPVISSLFPPDNVWDRNCCFHLVGDWEADMSLCCQYKVEPVFKPSSFNSKAQAISWHQPLALWEMSFRRAQQHLRGHVKYLATKMTYCGGQFPRTTEWKQFHGALASGGWPETWGSRWHRAPAQAPYPLLTMQACHNR